MRSVFCSCKECRLSLPLSRDDCEDALEEFFAGHVASRQLFDALCRVIDTIGPVELRVTKSQIVFGVGWRLRGRGCRPAICSASLCRLCSRSRSASGMRRRAGRRSLSRRRGVSPITWSCTPLPISMARCATGCATCGWLRLEIQRSGLSSAGAIGARTGKSSLTVKRSPQKFSM